ncbi:LamG domain-containing protein [Lewinella sp. W8]|uniref:LamG domain-containing protein n=1 Tax=Lewinella sp. W8 TaxID=2528208 RepID=UPI001068D1C6|nr:LamG domain-containing protein [Lewinella sp. W8]MTB53819.1 hypothetical protein [Lewinella sp. W8]
MRRFTRKLLLLLSLGALLAAGKVYGQNRALDFDGNDDDVTLNLIPTPLSTNAATFTVDLWFKSATVPGGLPCPMEYRSMLYIIGGQFLYEIGECGGVLQRSSFPAFPQQATAIPGATITPNQWQHLRVVHDNGTLEIYLDCNLVHTEAVSIPLGIQEFTLAEYTGLNALTAEHFQGRMDDVRIWTNVRDPLACDEIFCPLNGDETDLLVHWTFDQGVAGGNNTGILVATDATANGNDGQLANFTLTGNQSNFVNDGAGFIAPDLNGLRLKISDYPYRTGPLTSICSGDPAHFTLALPDGSTPGPYGNVAVQWEVSADAGATWTSLTSPPFTDFSFPILPGVLTVNCSGSTKGFEDRLYRAAVEVTDPITGRTCDYLSEAAPLKICCPISPATVSVAPSAALCEGESVSFQVQLSSPDPFVMTPGPNTTISWEVVDPTGVTPLPANQNNTAFTYAYTAPAVSAQSTVCFVARVTNCNGKAQSFDACVTIDPEPVCGIIEGLPLGAPQNLRLVSPLPNLVYEICPGEDAVLGIDPANPFQDCIPEWQYTFDLSQPWTSLGLSNTVQNTNVLPSHLWPAGATKIYYRIQCNPLSNPSGCAPCFGNVITIQLTTPPAVPIIAGSTEECQEDLPTTLMVTNPVSGLQYTWLWNGLPVGSGISHQASRGGQYVVTVSNACFTVQSDPHKLDACEVIAILSCPITPNDCARLGDKVIVEATESFSTCTPASLSYAWYLDGVLFPGVTGDQFSFTPPPGGSTVKVVVTDNVRGCMGMAERTVVPCDF